MLAAPQAKTYPFDEEDKLMEEEILKALKELQPTSTKIKAMILNTYLHEGKQFNLELEAELAQISLKYKKKLEPINHRSNEIITGKVPAEEELKGLFSYMTAEEAQKRDESFANIKPLEDYWLKAMKNSTIFTQFIHDRDDEVLKSLKTIQLKASDDNLRPHDFTLVFTFGPNDYFENDVLTKTFYMKDEKDCEKTSGVDIKWKDGKNLTKKSVTKKQKNKKTGKTRTITKEVDCDSFFKFFRSAEPTKHDHKEDEECEDDEQGNELQDQADFGTTLADELIPYHLEYYLNVKKELDFGGEGDDKAFGGGDDDDDDDDSEEEKPKKAKGKKPAAKKDTADVPKQECKQQ